MSRDPQTPPGGSRQPEPPRNLDEALAALQAERENRERAERERDAAILERDEMREAAPTADVAYWQDRCLDHATAYDKMRERAVLAERRLDEAVKALRDAWPEIDALARTGRASQSRRRHELVGRIRQFLEASQPERGAEGEAPSTERS